MNAQARQPLTPEEREVMIGEILELEEIEARRSSSRMEAFCFRFLPHLFKSEPGDFQRGIYADIECMLWQEEIDGNEVDAAAYAYPRGHGKTTTCVQGAVSWILQEWRNMPHFQGEPPFILIVSDTAGQAKDRLLDIRDELEGNQEIRAHYGNKVPSSKRRRTTDDDDGGGPAGTFKWTETDFQTIDGCRVMAVGTGSKVRGLLRSGRRPTFIVCDDLENDEHVSTRDQRNKLTRWLTKALIPTGIEGRLLTLVVGTILHADSVLSRLLADDQFEGWLKRRYAAAWDDSGLPNAEGPYCLWPSMWPLRLLHKRRAKIGSVAFSQEYLNQAIDDLTALFRWAWLQAAIERGRGAGFLYGEETGRIPFNEAISSWDLSSRPADDVQLVVTAWDVALVADEKAAQARDSDYSVGLTVVLTANDRLKVRRIYRKRGITPKALRGKVVAENTLLRPDYVVVENNTASMAHEIELRGVPGLPLRGHTTDHKKHSVFEGVPGLALILETNRMDFCWETAREKRSVEVLRDELHGLGMEAHDDTVMALWMAVLTIRKWQRMRDRQRRKFLGPPPTEYSNPWPTRYDADQEAA